MLQYFIINKEEIETLISNPLAPRQRDYHEIMWVQKGVANVVIDGEYSSIEANTLFIFPKDRIHQFLPKQVITGQVIRFSEDILDDFPRLLFSKFNQVSKIKTEQSDKYSLELLFKLFEIEYQLHAKKSPILTNLLKTTLYKLNSIKKDQLPCQKINQYSIDLFDQFQILLDQYILEHKKVDFYAQKLNVTPRKLGETIKFILNKTTSEIISQRMLIECKKQLFYSKKSITEIAYDLGFEDNSYFTKFFKKYVGLTPSQYRSK